MTNTVIYALLGVIALQEILHRQERKDLYSRIMSKDITDYRQDKTKPPKCVSAHRKALDRWRKGGDSV